MGSRGKKADYTKEEVLLAISGCKTIISTVARKLNCSWDCANKQINKWEETKQAYENEREKVIDVAESKLFTNIQKGDLGAIKYFLSKKAKDRGYSDLIDGSDGQLKVDNTLHIVIDD